MLRTSSICFAGGNRDTAELIQTYLIFDFRVLLYFLWMGSHILYWVNIKMIWFYCYKSKCAQVTDKEVKYTVHKKTLWEHKCSSYIYLNYEMSVSLIPIYQPDFKDFFSHNQKFSWLWSLYADLSAPSSAWPDPWGAGSSAPSWPTDAAGRWESAHTSPVRKHMWEKAKNRRLSGVMTTDCHIGVPQELENNGWEYSWLYF